MPRYAAFVALCSLPILLWALKSAVLMTYKKALIKDINNFGDEKSTGSAYCSCLLRAIEPYWAMNHNKNVLQANE